ncbi:hypothetical protein [Micromonospora viridifaciens]|nr:hypothetical protein [Micromonospora viridifaciens]
MTVDDQRHPKKQQASGHVTAAGRVGKATRGDIFSGGLFGRTGR